MKGIFVILDGVADEVCSQLKGKTPLEYAKTPNLDYFATNGVLYSCFPIASGIAPQSSSGLMSLFGVDFRDYPRGMIESVGVGVHLNDGDLALRCNFGTIDSLNNMKLIDRRAGRTLTTKEARELADAVNSKVKLPFKFELIPTVGHRAVLVFRGNFSANITNVDPSYEDGLSVVESSEKVVFSKACDDSNKSALSADLLNTFIRKSYVVLENHPVNLKRVKKGLFAANFVLCRDPSVKAPEIKKLPGIWFGLGYMPLEIGVAKILGMRLASFIVPSMDRIDFYEYAELVLDKAIKKAIETIEGNRDLADYFYIHFKETDLAGHDNKPMQKVKFIEKIDREFFGYLRGVNDKFRMVVTADHTTSCRRKSHTADPVPVLFYGAETTNSEKRFTEKDANKEKSIIGRQLLNKTLFL